MARGRSRKKKMVLDDPRDEYLSRFVHEVDGRIIGETIGLEKEMIVIKNGDDFFVAPLSSFELDDNVLKVIVPVNWNKAREEGEDWKNKELDPLWSDK
jgi:hypothetical protein